MAMVMLLLLIIVTITIAGWLDGYITIYDYD